MNPTGPRSKARQSILWAILVLALAALCVIRIFLDIPHQAKNLQTANVLLITFALLNIWVLGISGLPWSRRLAWTLILWSPVLLTPALFTIKGVTGDLVPLLELRWKPKTALKAPIKTSTTVVAVRKEAAPPSFPQFLGPNRNGVLATSVREDWKANPPRELWRVAVGPSWSGFSTSEYYAITHEQLDDVEAITCRDLLTGKMLWSHTDIAHYNTKIAGEGPRTTPTIHDGKVFALGATGILNCLDLKTGHAIWSTNVVEQHHVKLPDWGLSSAPLILGDMVIVFPGGHKGHAIAAYDYRTGKLKWSAGNDSTSYSSPVAMNILGETQIVAFNSHNVSGHKAATGETLWEFAWPGGHPHIAMPVQVSTNRVLISSGYGTGAALVEISKGSDNKWSASQVWRSNKLKSKFANIILWQGNAYGLDDGIMTCVDVANGSQRWKDGRFGHGQLLLCKDLFVLMAESGDVRLIRPNPDRLEELASFPALHGKTWNPPVIAGRYLLVRNDQEAACYDIGN